MPLTFSTALLSLVGSGRCVRLRALTNAGGGGGGSVLAAGAGAAGLGAGSATGAGAGLVGAGRVGRSGVSGPGLTGGRTLVSTATIVGRFTPPASAAMLPASPMPSWNPIIVLRR